MSSSDHLNTSYSTLSSTCDTDKKCTDKHHKKHHKKCTDKASTCNTNTSTDICTQSTQWEQTCSTEYSSGCTYEESCENILGRKKYNITFHNHHIYINGKKNPILKLRRGFVYYFDIEQEKCNRYDENLFVLTKDICSTYPTSLCNSFDPVGHGCVKYHVTDKTPKYFFYQNATHTCISGLILLN